MRSTRHATPVVFANKFGSDLTGRPRATGFRVPIPVSEKARDHPHDLRILDMYGADGEQLRGALRSSATRPKTHPANGKEQL